MDEMARDRVTLVTPFVYLYARERSWKSKKSQERWSK